MRALLILAALLAAPQAYAGDTSSSVASSQASTQSTASNQGNTQALIQNAASKQTVYEVPSVGASALAASLTGCIGSVSVGAGWAGFGATAGKTVKDDQCERRANAEVLNGLGDHATARQLMCLDPEVKKADALASRSCK